MYNTVHVVALTSLEYTVVPDLQYTTYKYEYKSNVSCEVQASEIGSHNNALSSLVESTYLLTDTYSTVVFIWRLISFG